MSVESYVQVRALGYCLVATLPVAILKEVPLVEGQRIMFRVVGDGDQKMIAITPQGLSPDFVPRKRVRKKKKKKSGRT